MPTSVPIGIQDLNTTIYEKQKLFLTVDRAYGVGANTKFALSAKIRGITLGINENIGTVNLEYPDHPFGSFVGQVVPIACFIDNADNFVFRGFIIEDEGVLDRNNDQVNALAFDYKWFMAKIGKIRGKIYTVDNNVFPDARPGGAGRVFVNESLYEKFRYALPGYANPNSANFRFDRLTKKDGTGYLGSEKTIFNTNGDPDCANGYPNNLSVFIVDPDIQYLNNVRALKRSNTKYYWNYATMIYYIVRQYISATYNGISATTRIDVDMSGLSNIIRFGQKYGMSVIQPLNFDITNLDPVQAIDKIVKDIPGSWYWFIRYFKDTVLITVRNYSDPDFRLKAKSLFIGTGAKLNDKTNNNVNTAGVRVKRSSRNAVSHAVAVGGAFDIETTIQYLPGWQQYLRPVDDISGSKNNINDYIEDSAAIPYSGGNVDSGYYISNFKGVDDYRKWKQFVERDAKTDNSENAILANEITADDQERYNRIGRIFVFPENQSQIVNNFINDYQFRSLIPGYENFLAYIDQLFYRFILRVRKVKNPVTQYRELFNYATFQRTYTTESVKKELRNKNSNDPPFVFLYDDLLSSTISGESGGRSTDFLNNLRVIIPTEEKGNSFSFENDNKILIFSNPQLKRKTPSVPKYTKKKPLPEFSEAAARICYVTCRVECDVPLVKDKQLNRQYYAGARLVHQEFNPEVSSVVRLNAYFPTPPGSLGSNLSFDEENRFIGTVTNEETVIETGPGIRVVDWNQIEYGSSAPQMVIDEIRFLDNIIAAAIEQRPVYEIEGDFDLGRLDASFHIGDVIDRIVNSELADGSGGYYNIPSVLDKLDYTAVNETIDSFTTRGTFKNNLPVVHIIDGKKGEKRVNR